MATINEVLTLTDHITPKLSMISSGFTNLSATSTSFKENMSGNLSSVSSSFNGADSSFMNFETAVLKGMAVIVSTIQNSSTQMENAVKNSASSMHADFSNAMEQMSKSSKQTVTSLDGIKESISGIKKPVGNVPKDPMKPIKESSEKAKTSVLGLSAAITLMNKGLNLITSYIGKAFDRADTIDQFSKTVTLLTGNVNVANNLMDQLSSTMKGTPYALDAAASGMQRLITSGRDLGLVTTDTERWADAVAVYAGGSTEALSSVMDANAKMLTRGKVNLEQLNRMMEAGIPVIDLYAKTTGQSTETISKAISDGKISAVDFMDTMNTAFTSLEGSAKNAGSTWNGTFANFGSAMSRGLLTIIDGFDNAIQSSGLPSIKEIIASTGKGIETMMGNIGGVFSKLQPVFHIVKQIGETIAVLWKKNSEKVSQNFNSIITKINSIAAILGSFINAVLPPLASALSFIISLVDTLATSIISNLDAIIPILMVIGASLIPGMITKLWAMVPPVITQAAAWLAVNWPILLVVAAVIGIIALLKKLGVSSQQILGTIGQAFGWLASTIWNITVVPLYNIFATLGEFLANVFNDPLGSVVRLFSSMADIVLGILQSLAEAIDAVFGSNLASAVSGWRDSLSSAVTETFGESSIKYDRLENMDVNEAMQIGGDIGVNIANNLDSLTDTLSGGLGGLTDSLTGGSASLSELVDSGLNVAGGDLDSVGKIKSDVSIDSEELKMMTDMAQDKYIADRNIYVTNQTTANFGDVHETADVNQILSTLEENVISSYETNLVGAG